MRLYDDLGLGRHVSKTGYDTMRGSDHNGPVYADLYNSSMFKWWHLFGALYLIVAWLVVGYTWGLILGR